MGTKLFQMYKKTSIISLMFVAAIILLLGLNSNQAHARTTQEVETVLQHGVATAVRWDTICRDYLRNNAWGAGWSSSPSLRNYINWGAAYQGSTWMSTKGRGNTSVPIEIDYGAESVDLQINDVQFLCATLVAPNRTSERGLTGGSLVNDNQRWVTSTGNANDRAPNPIGASGMLPALVLVTTKILSAEGSDTLSGVSSSGVVSSAINNRTLDKVRDNNSRYWISNPVEFSYRFSSPATQDGSINITASYKRLSGYHATVEKLCIRPGGGSATRVSSVDECAVGYMGLSITVRIRPGFLLKPTITASPPTIPDEGENKISVNAQTSNVGSQASDNVNWVVSRFVVAPGSTLSKKPGRSDPKDNFSGYLDYSVQKSGSKQFITGGANNVATYEDDQTKYPAGTKLCYVNSVAQYASGNRNWEHSQPSCVTVSKLVRPKVQVWGGDVKTGEEVVTSVNRVVNHGVAQQQMTEDQLIAAGLWRTGYDKNGNLLSASGDGVDGHWSIVCAKSNKGLPHYQRAYNASGSAVDLANCTNNVTSMTVKHQARAIRERANSVGMYTCPPYPSILGDVDWCTNANRGPWSRTSEKARWIGLNYYGMHTSFRGRPDPSTYAGNDPACIKGVPGYIGVLTGVYNCGNVYVFRLSGVNFNDIAGSLKSIKLGFAGAVDNLVQVRINGQAAQMSSYRAGSAGEVINNYAHPVWFKDSVFYASFEGSAVSAIKPTDNTIDVYIVSDYTHVGLLIEDISVSYTVDTVDTKTYGSWGEYGMAAKGKIESASGAGLSSSYQGRDISGGAQAYNKITFANNSASTFGNFTNNPVVGTFNIPSVKPKNSSRLSGAVDVSGLNGEYQTTGEVSLTGGTLLAGRSVVIRSNNTVRISGDLLYGAVTGVSSLPQLIIYAKNIIIEPGVKEVNAWLVTSNDGYVSTCGSVIAPENWLSGLSMADCSRQQLKVNGPIMAGHLYLRRAYGGQHDSPAQNNPTMHPGTPAEILNLRADAYMWGYNYARNSGAIRTMNLKELPPRY